MKLLYTFKTPEGKSVSKVTTWLVYSECIYFNSIKFYSSQQPITTFSYWIRKGELIQIGKPI